MMQYKCLTVLIVGVGELTENLWRKIIRKPVVVRCHTGSPTEPAMLERMATNGLKANLVIITGETEVNFGDTLMDSETVGVVNIQNGRRKSNPEGRRALKLLDPHNHLMPQCKRNNPSVA